jgi:hypothetical protein
MAVDLQDLRPSAFLFAAPLRGEEEGETLDEAFLTALKAADPHGQTDTRVYRGGLLLAQLSYKPSSIKAELVPSRKSGSPATFRTTHTEHSHPPLYAVLVGDFVETCLGQWNTLNPSTYWSYIANRAIDATFTSSLSAAIVENMDKRLRSHPRYIGAVSPDLGNPLHRYLFVDVMFKDAFIRNGRVFVQAGFEGDYNGSFFGADTFSPLGMATLPYEKFETEAPPAHLPDSRSARGLVTEMRTGKRMALDIHQKVMSALGKSRSLRTIERSFEWNLSQLPDAADEIMVQAEKLMNYLLDPEKDGGGKARFFERRLAITRKDWVYLHGQLIDGLGNLSFEDIRLDMHGVRFNAYFPVTGLNGKTATIKTGWIIRPDERASFVTAFPAEEDSDLESQASPPLIVSDDLEGDARWQAVYVLAEQTARKEMEECVPKPLVVESQVYMEGDCGGAFVVIEDGRTSFARWLRKKGLGHSHHSRGYSIAAERIGQSVESAKAYADALARVLRRNGVECRAEVYLT